MKIKNINILLTVFAFAILVNSCDIIEPPYKEDNGNTPVDTTAKVVLLEEYTGFLCGNCPAAGRIAHAIKEKYPDNVILLAVHAGALALPTPKHKYNFISQVMKDLDGYFDIGYGLGTPNGLVDRALYNSATILPETEWEAAVVERMKKPASIKIDLTPSYNSTNKTISCSAKMKFLSEAPSSYHLALYVVEDSIVQFQKDYSKAPNVDIEDYVHNNIIRDALTNTFGNPISDAVIKKDSEITLEYSKVIPGGADWRPQWIRIVAIITDNNNNYEVIQCKEKYILK
jgi:hypothetical protein